MGLRNLFIACSDGRLEFFRGNGDGSFVADGLLDPGFDLGFLFAAEALLAGDFDQDDDIDLVVVNFYGELAVIENPGTVAEDGAAPNVVRMSVPFLENPELWYHVRELQAHDLNGDGDPELDSRTGRRVGDLRWRRWTDIRTRVSRSWAGRPSAAGHRGCAICGERFLLWGTMTVTADTDMAVACFTDGCLTLLAKEPDGFFHEAQKVKVPPPSFSPRVISTVTDWMIWWGLEDLRCWVALSGAQSGQGGVPMVAFVRAQETRLVINEFYAKQRFRSGKRITRGAAAGKIS